VAQDVYCAGGLRSSQGNQPRVRHIGSRLRRKQRSAKIAAARCSLTPRAAAGRRSWRRTARERAGRYAGFVPGGMGSPRPGDATGLPQPQRNCTATQIRGRSWCQRRQRSPGADEEGRRIPVARVRA
jgi:hypothetical protein